MNKKEKIILVILLAIVAIVLYYFLSKKKEEEQENTVIASINQATKVLQESSQANQTTAENIVAANDQTTAKQKWITSGFEPNIGESIYVATGKSVKLLKNNSGSANVKKTIEAGSDYPNGRLVGTIHKSTTSNYWNVVPASNTGVSTRQWIRKSDYRNNGILYVMR